MNGSQRRTSGAKALMSLRLAARLKPCPSYKAGLLGVVASAVLAQTLPGWATVLGGLSTLIRTEPRGSRIMLVHHGAHRRCPGLQIASRVGSSSWAIERHY